MKVLIIFAFLIATVFAFRGYTDAHNGRPGCKTAEEMSSKRWRNNYNQAKYWECKVPGVAGEARDCPKEHLYQPKLFACVKAVEWVWTPLEDPPSLG